MASKNAADTQPSTIALLNERDCTVQLSWYGPAPGDKLEAVGGIAPMQPHGAKVEALRPGLNYVRGDVVASAGGPARLPSSVTVEDPLELRGRVAMDAIQASAMPALRRWLADEKRARSGDPKADRRAEIRKAIEDRISELESKRFEVAA